MSCIAEPVTIDGIKAAHQARKGEIERRLAEFAAIWERGSDLELLEEMFFCFFTGGCSARMGLNSVAAIRSIMMTGSREQIAAALSGSHRYPNARARYVAESRDFLKDRYGLKLRDKLSTFTCPLERRDWLVNEKGIKGLGYKEASHYLRNIGFKGYAILDKHVLRCMTELKIIADPKPPNTRAKYLTIEEKLKQLTVAASIDFDELDLVLWSMKTGVILK